MQIREARLDEWETYRDLRMAALADAPDSFRTTVVDVSDRTDDEWRSSHERAVQADDMVPFFAMDDEPVGMALARIDGTQLQIFGMWVAPQARGKGLGRALIDATFAWGKVRGATSARLGVTIGNGGGERLYTRAGFEPTGETEPLRDGSELTCAWLERSL